MIKRLYTIIFVLFIALTAVKAQLFNPFDSEKGGEVRLIYHQKIKLNDLYTSSFDAGPYLGVGTNTWTRWGLRGSISKKLGDRSAADIGFMYNHTTSEESKKQEYRPHQSYNIKYPALKHSVINHRFRLEERFLTSNTSAKNTFRTRLRYRISNSGSFKKRAVAPKSLFYRLSAEWNFNIYNEVKNQLFLRGRYGAGIGYMFNSQYSLDATYYYQHDHDNDDVTSLNIFLLTLRHNIRLNRN